MPETEETEGEETPIRHKCDPENGYVCVDLAERAQMWNEVRGRSITAWNFVKGFDPSYLGIGYKMPKPDKGLLFSFCPFCGTELKFEVEVDGKKRFQQGYKPRDPSNEETPTYLWGDHWNPDGTLIEQPEGDGDTCESR